MIDVPNDQIKKALVTLAIEQTLLEFGPPALEKVSNKLFEDYHCYIPDCYMKPEYLNKVLKELFGNSHTVIVQSIRKRLEELASQDPIKNFLAKLSE
ncbi:MAG: hypothetical protein ACT4N1_03745 [Nitrososphaerota archaeon]